ncbi:hypothetical protein EPA93_32505 [Ktedonosporobacter rubrisoli]|uniref:Uncharacterized protein n=1 Tax=Ktedonosporobacter rubrisoli TaxID=2509675 RepID=A0A4P6JYA3_KTERU|nr:hypothetical protein [Ktedonosporobacter rubrisoli]QBD80443.1 hypothetical protein EPA93_32505 [Ktedonosporobacter rubrisoli]
MWWVELGYYSFEPGENDFPRPGQVIRYYRQQKFKSDGKCWTQQDLANALGLTEQAVCLMETKDLGLDSITRRRVLIRILQIPAILLGLAEIPQLSSTSMESGVGNKAAAINISFYEEQLRSYYNAHHRKTTHQNLPQIQKEIAEMYQILPISHDKERVSQILSRYHIMAASIMRDQCLFNQTIEHLDRAIYFTTQNKDYEFLADAYYRQGWTYLEQGKGEKAIQSFLLAEKLAQKIPTYMKAGILIGLGRSLALETQNKQDSLEALRTLDKAANMLRTYPPPDGNPHYLEIEIDRFHTDRSASLIDISFPHDALQELSYIRSDHNNQRRIALTRVLYAKTYFALKDYPEACYMAEEALHVIQPIRSKVNYQQIKKLYRQLKNTNFKDNPEVAHLEILIDKMKELGQI